MITTTFDELIGGKTTLATLVADRLEAIDIDETLKAKPGLFGICSIVLNVLHELNVPKELFVFVRSRIAPEPQQPKDNVIWIDYPHYSGNPDYPLPCPIDVGLIPKLTRWFNHARKERIAWDESQCAAYCAFHVLDRWHGEYGAVRLEALQWLIDYLRANPECLSIKETV